MPVPDPSADHRDRLDLRLVLVLWVWLPLLAALLLVVWRMAAPSAVQDNWAGIAESSARLAHEIRGSPKPAATLREALTGLQGYALLVDQDGGLIGDSLAPNTRTRLPRMPRNLAELAKHVPEWSPIAVQLHQKTNLPKNLLQFTIGGDPWLEGAVAVHVRPLEERGWRLLRVMPLNAVRTEGAEARQTHGLLAGVLGLAFMLGAHLLLRWRLLHDIVKLSRSAASDEPLGVGGATEVGVLSHRLERFRSRQRDLLDALRQSESQRNTERATLKDLEKQVTELRRHALPPAETDDPLWRRRLRNGLDHGKFHLTTQWLMPAGPLNGEKGVFEVLLTLEDEEGFWIEPQSFLPAAQRLRLATEVDRWVIRHTLEHLEQHPAVAAQVGMACINLSPESLHEAGMLEFLMETLTRPRQWRGRLCFEIAETVLCSHAAVTFCETLKHLGARIAADRFRGRDPVSLSALARLPLDYVKLEGRELRNLGNDSGELELAESGLRLGRLHRRTVIVTGIEDPQALTAWKSLDADYLQGYAIARPTPLLFSCPEPDLGKAQPANLRLLKTKASG